MSAGAMKDKGTKPSRSFLSCFFPVVDCIADLLGPNCEVVLHDISKPGHSILKIRNGHVTGRKEGDALTDLGLEMIKEAEKGLEVLGNYNPKTKNGRVLKSNAINIKDTDNRLVGIICINLDTSEFKKTEEKLHQVIRTINEFCFVGEERTTKVKEERFESDLWSIIQQIINEIINKKGKLGERLTKKDRVEVIRALEEKGIFFARGAIHYVSKSLGLSTSTVYRYLEELKSIAREVR